MIRRIQYSIQTLVVLYFFGQLDELGGKTNAVHVPQVAIEFKLIPYQILWVICTADGCIIIGECTFNCSVQRRAILFKEVFTSLPDGLLKDIRVCGIKESKQISEYTCIVTQLYPGK